MPRVEFMIQKARANPAVQPASAVITQVTGQEECLFLDQRLWLGAA